MLFRSHIGDTIILPLVDVSFAVGAGAFSEEKKEKGAGGLGGKMTPCAVLVIQDGKTRLVNIKNQDTMTKILDMIPDAIDKFTYTVGNTQGGRFLVDYPLPAPGISHGMAITHGMLVGRILATL